MPDKRMAPGAPEGALGRKREAPTIDLTATELARSPVESAPPPADPPGPAEPQKPEPMQEPPSDPPPSPPPEQQPPPAVDEPPAPPEEPPHRGSNWLGALAAGVAGGVVMAIALGALWYSGALPAATPQSTDTSAQVAALQKQIQDLQNRPAPTAAPTLDSKAIDALNGRLANMETTLASLPKSDGNVAERLSAAENAMTSLGVALTALNKRSDDVAANVAQARAQAEAAEKAVTQLRGSVQDVAKDASSTVAPEQLNALQQRVAALEQSSKAAGQEIAKTAAAEKAARLALSAAALRNAVTSGAPYSAELAQAKTLGADEKIVAPLEPFATTGLPNAAALAQELRALLPAILKASGAQAPQGGGFLERLQANASKLVRVTPVDAPPGDDPSAVLVRVEIAAAHADIPSAIANLAKLPEAARAPAQNWIAKAQARQAALAAANTFAADSARSLNQP